ncbi:hypothetical protein T02_5071 [Trichinella nativa]|uniref:Uncharacterized protein n=1 Tax=Trichinella nativa TaxID=6335 RepID=A0A0V1KNC1_9BILA|nr:hypothetical protein T02_5071 [Trichinella nativa]
MEQQKEFSAAQLMVVRHIRDVAAQKKLSSLKQRLIGAQFRSTHSKAEEPVDTRKTITKLILKLYCDSTK